MELSIFRALINAILVLNSFNFDKVLDFDAFIIVSINFFIDTMMVSYGLNQEIETICQKQDAYQNYNNIVGYMQL